MFWFIVVQNKVINLLELLLGRYFFFGICMCVVGSDECARAVVMSSSVFKVYVPGKM